METKSQDLLKLLGEDIPLPEEEAANKLILELLKSEERTLYPRPDQIKNSTAEAQQYFDQHEQLAFWATKPLKVFIGKYLIDQEDFEQMVRQSLWVAALTFDQSRGTKFTTWGTLVIRHYFSREINRCYIRTGRIGQKVQLLAEDGEEIILRDIEDYRELSIFDKVLAHEILDNIYNLQGEGIADKSRASEILVERLIWDLTLKECGMKRKLTRERIRQIETKGMQMLKAVYHSGKAKLIH